MISARGAMPTQTILTEVALAKAKQSSGKATLVLPELERAWSAVGKVLKAQLLLGNTVAVGNKACTFAISHRLAMHDGRTRYLLRVPDVTFHPSYVTTYGLAHHIPRDSATGVIRRLPMDYVSAEARLPADVVSDALREVFLYVGEMVFQGRLVMLEFDGVATVLLKRDRMSAHFTDAFLDELYAIDTRKWPAAAREAGEAVRPRAIRDPREAVVGSAAAVPRPSSGRSSSRAPTSARAASSDGPRAPRPAFASAAPAGRCFEEIVDELPKVERLREVRLSALRKAAVGVKGGRPRSKRAPLAAVAVPDQTAAAAAVPPLHMDPAQLRLPSGCPAGEVAPEEESIYSIMTPHRLRDVGVSPASRSHYQSARAEAATTPQAHLADLQPLEEASPESDTEESVYPRGAQAKPPLSQPPPAYDDAEIATPEHVRTARRAMDPYRPYATDSVAVPPPVDQTAKEPTMGNLPEPALLRSTYGSARSTGSALNIFDLTSAPTVAPEQPRGRRRITSAGSSHSVRDALIYQESIPAPAGSNHHSFRTQHL